MPAKRAEQVRICVETGTRRAFASALDWPGWCRSGRSATEALEVLVAYAPRYAPVPATAGVPFSLAASSRLEVVERLEGSATTDFGAPGAIGEADRAPLSPGEASRLCALLRACWDLFDHVAENAPAELRKGPRGGGRDRDQVVEHVTVAELAYARKMGARAAGDLGEARGSLLRALVEGSAAPWPPRYAARRRAWHVLDHAWEIEDRS